MRSRFNPAFLDELQKSVMKIRMVPVEQLFRRFPRIVRDVAKLRNKEIALEIAGRTPIWIRAFWTRSPSRWRTWFAMPPITASNRPPNAQAAGKPARGTIRLDALSRRRSGGDRSFRRWPRARPRKDISQRAIERGIVSAKKLRRLNESEAHQLIFTPGFSTADEMTEISGRGVGSMS